LTHASDEYRILTDDTELYKLVVTEAKLHVPVAVIHPAEWEKMLLTLHLRPARITFTRTILDTHPIPAGQLNFASDNIIATRQLPCRMLIFFIRSVAFNGAYKRNPLELVRTVCVRQKLAQSWSAAVLRLIKISSLDSKVGSND
jgi:hypothetical protein